jgi:hypothetical protein
MLRFGETIKIKKRVKKCFRKERVSTSIIALEWVRVIFRVIIRGIHFFLLAKLQPELRRSQFGAVLRVTGLLCQDIL